MRLFSIVLISLISLSHVSLWAGVNEDLLSAAEKGNKEKVTSLLDQKADINFKNSVKQTPLIISIENKHPEIAKLLINKGAKIDEPDSMGKQAIHYAAEKGFFELLKLLVDKGASVNSKTELKSNKGLTPLHLASKSGHKEIVKFLLDKGADVNVKYSSSWGFSDITPLYVAAAEGHGEIARMLIAKGADKKVASKETGTILHAASAGGILWLAEDLIKDGHNINAKAHEGRTPIYAAIYKKREKMALYLIEKGAELNYKSKSGETLLITSAEKGLSDVSKKLIDKGLDKKAKSKSGYTVLHAACKGGLTWLVKDLVSQGADPNAITTYNTTPLFFAIRADNPELINLLIDSGAKLSVLSKMDEKEIPYIAISIYYNSKKAIKTLIEKGEDINAEFKVRSGKYSALSYSISMMQVKHDPDIPMELIKRGADIHKTSSVEYQADKMTPLHVLAMSANKNVKQLYNMLIKKGAQIETKDGEGNTALHLAAGSNNIAMVKLLLASGANKQAKNESEETPYDKAYNTKVKELLNPEKSTTALVVSNSGDSEMDSPPVMTGEPDTSEPVTSEPVITTNPSEGLPEVAYHSIQKGQTLRQIAQHYYGDGRKVYLLRYFYNQRRKRAGLITVWARPLPWMYDQKIWLAGTLVRVDKPVRIENELGERFKGYVVK